MIAILTVLGIGFGLGSAATCAGICCLRNLRNKLTTLDP